MFAVLCRHTQEGFIRESVAAQKPFFFYFCSHHTHAPQFAPEEFLGYSRRGLHGDSLGLIDRSAGRIMQLSTALDIDANTLMIFSADVRVDASAVLPMAVLPAAGLDLLVVAIECGRRHADLDVASFVERGLVGLARAWRRQRRPTM